MLSFLGKILIKLLEFLVSLLMSILTLLVQYLPLIVKLLVEVFRGFLRLSLHAYRFIVEMVSPTIQNWTGLDLTQGIWRIVATTLLSLALGFLLIWVFQWKLNAWILGIAAVHGLLVGLAWGVGTGDSLIDGLNLGVDHR